MCLTIQPKKGNNIWQEKESAKNAQNFTVGSKGKKPE
jgi:hypothetical protein